MAASVHLDMKYLLQDLNDNESSSKDIFANSKELKVLSSTIRREQEFYKTFLEEFLHHIRNSNIIESLKSDKDVSYILLNSNSLNEFND